MGRDEEGWREGKKEGEKKERSKKAKITHKPRKQKVPFYLLEEAKPRDRRSEG